MNLFYFRHFYTIPHDTLLLHAHEQSKRIGNNPLFLTKEGIMIGYVIHGDIQQNIQDYPNSAVENYLRIPHTIAYDDEQSIADACAGSIFLLKKEGSIVAWTRPSSELPHLRIQPLSQAQKDALCGHSKRLPDIAHIAQKSDCTVFLVGGVVRDLLKERPIADFDFLVQGNVHTLADALVQNLGGSVHKEHLFDAAHWTDTDGNTYDFTIARSEWYPSIAALPETQKGTILDDITRRDFSTNALLISLTPEGPQHIIDATNGIHDLENNLLRILHDKSLHDDPTRIFRASRYAARYGLTCTQNTEQALSTALTEAVLSQLSWERIGKELHYIFRERAPEKCWAELSSWGVLESLFPSQSIDIHTILSSWRYLHKLSYIPSDAAVDMLCWIPLAIALQNKKECSAMVQHIKGGIHLWKQAPSTIVNTHKKLTSAQDNGDVGEALHGLSLELLVYLYPSHPSPILWWLGEGMHMNTIVDGSFLLQEGCPKGPAIGKAVKIAKRAAWMGATEEEQRNIAKSVWME